MNKKHTPFANQIYSQLKKVPKGRVTTYKHLAESIDSKAYRAVGQILKNNPFSPHVPCHRVVKSDGALGGFLGETGGKEFQKKIQLLESEGVEIKNGKIKNFRNVIY